MQLSKWSIRIIVAVFIVSSAIVHTGCEPRNLDDVGDVAAPKEPDRDTSKMRRAVWPPENWPPKIEVKEECHEIDKDGGSFDYLDGQCELVMPRDTMPDDTDVCATRALIDASSDLDLIGYVWGPHGVPLDPPATIRVRVPVSWVPREAKTLEDAVLTTKDDDGNYQLIDATAPAPIIKDGMITLEATVTKTTPVMVGIFPLPSP